MFLQGLNAIVTEGPLIKAPVCGINVIIQDGKTHLVDSTDIAMYNTMINMMREAYIKAQWIILEPIMKVEVTLPSEFEVKHFFLIILKLKSVVMKSLSSRKGIMESSDVVDEFTTLVYEVIYNFRY